MLQRQEVKELIKQALEQKLGFPSIALQDNIKLHEIDQAFDSLAFAELQFVLEDEFKIVFPELDLNALTSITLEDLTDFIYKSLQANYQQPPSDATLC